MHSLSGPSLTRDDFCAERLSLRTYSGSKLSSVPPDGMKLFPSICSIYVDWNRPASRLGPKSLRITLALLLFLSGFLDSLLLKPCSCSKSESCLMEYHSFSSMSVRHACRPGLRFRRRLRELRALSGEQVHQLIFLRHFCQVESYEGLLTDTPGC